MLTFYADGNSSKNHANQPKVVDNICEQLRAGDVSITGVMIESNLREGRQDVPPEGPSGLKYGVSITDACVDWPVTVAMLDRLNEVRSLQLTLARRSTHPSPQAVAERRSKLIAAGLNKHAAEQ